MATKTTICENGSNCPKYDAAKDTGHNDSGYCSVNCAISDYKWLVNEANAVGMPEFSQWIQEQTIEGRRGWTVEAR